MTARDQLLRRALVLSVSSILIDGLAGGTAVVAGLISVDLEVARSYAVRAGDGSRRGALSA